MYTALIFFPGPPPTHYLKNSFVNVEGGRFVKEKLEIITIDQT